MFSKQEVNVKLSQELLEFIEKWKDKKGNLIMILHKVQEEYGYIPREVALQLSKMMNVPLAKIYGVVTFYHYFSLKPKGDHTCTVCTGTACYVKGSQKIVDHIEKVFSVKPGSSTLDNKLGLQTARCVGACGLAPVVIVDTDIIGRAVPEEAEKAVLKKLGQSV